MFELFLDGLDIGDVAMLAAADDILNPQYDPGLYAGDPRASNAVIDVVPLEESIRQESAKRQQSKGGALVRKQDGPSKQKGVGARAARAGRDAEVARNLIDAQLQQAKGKILRRAGVGAAAAGLAGLGINAMQDDSNGNIIVNPVTQAAVSTGIGMGLGGMTGVATAPVAETLAGKQGMQAVRQLSPAEVMNARRSRGVRGAAIGTGAGALISLMQALKNEETQPQYYPYP